MASYRSLKWRGLKLLGPHKRLMVEIVADGEWPGLFRVLRPDGGLSDMVNLSRAKDAALTLALAQLNAP